MVLYVKDDETLEIHLIRSLSDFKAWGGAVSRQESLIESGFDEAFLEHCEEIAPSFFEDGNALWTDEELNNYLWFDEDFWKGSIGFLSRDELYDLIHYNLHNLKKQYELTAICDVFNQYGINLPNVDAAKVFILDSEDKVFENEKFADRTDEQIFDFMAVYSSSVPMLISKLAEASLNPEIIFDAFRKAIDVDLESEINKLPLEKCKDLSQEMYRIFG